MNSKRAYVIQNLRFPIFHNAGNWEEVKMRDIFVRVTTKNKEDNKNVLTISAQYGLVSQFDYFNKNIASVDVSNYYLIKKGDFAYNKSRSQGYPYGTIKPLLLYDKGVVSPLYICFRLKENAGNEDFFRHYFETSLINAEIAKIAQEGARNHGLLNISTEDFFNIRLRVPSYAEQRRIAECLSSIDELINTTNKKLDLLILLKEGMMQILFPQRETMTSEQNSNELRKIQKCTLGDITYIVNRRNKSNRVLPIYSVNNKDGFIPQSEQFDGLDSKSRGYDTSMYKIVGKNTFAYNPARINVGSIGYSGNLKDVLISSLYVCFKTIDEVDDDFLMCFFNTAQFQQAVDNNVEGGIRSYLFYENFSRIQIALPSLQEQKKIAKTILSIDDVISKYTDKVSLLEDYKKGLMQQLFPTITK